MKKIVYETQSRITSFLVLGFQQGGNLDKQQAVELFRDMRRLEEFIIFCDKISELNNSYKTAFKTFKDSVAPLIKKSLE